MIIQPRNTLLLFYLLFVRSISRLRTPQHPTKQLQLQSDQVEGAGNSFRNDSPRPLFEFEDTNVILTPLASFSEYNHDTKTFDDESRSRILISDVSESEEFNTTDDEDEFFFSFNITNETLAPTNNVTEFPTSSPSPIPATFIDYYNFNEDDSEYHPIIQFIFVSIAELLGFRD
eukprot:CAMPEP_0178942890 /NCGR_PEP_ID=MMETSP0789-20121207/2259_1 /TAXON_ID=3005 /ORGANISM="Rhizosolenia setigera, Strain CCMP 1694" /LENGTH=173 /DNA_ID=CAMNT_0020622377 /DNA_START=58 /DNA_END=576 /DNA_ORIENTATION=+